MAKKPPKVESNGDAKPGGEPAPKACYVLSLEVENVRCFGPKQKLDMSNGKGGPAQWTIILGENGAGKTTLLQLLTSFELAIPSHNYNTLITQSKRLHHYHTKLALIGDSNGWFSFPRKVSENQTSVCGLVSVMLDNLHGAIDDVVPHHFQLTIRGSSCTSNFHFELAPMYNAYGISRRLRSVMLSQSDHDDPVATLFDDEAHLRNAEDWLLRLDYAAKSTNLPADAQRRDQVKHLLISILSDIDDLRFQTTSGPNPRQWVEFQTFSGWVPLRRLGYGYQTLVAWVLDFVSRMIERYPDSPDPLKEPAIVIVDEIDLHLHPAWQRKLIAFLTERFPNTQFIVTAHSPLIVQAVEDANIVVLKRVGDHVEIINDPDQVRGWGVDQILTSNLFDLKSARPPHVEKLLTREQELLAKSKLTKAEQRELKEIQEKIEKLPVGNNAQSTKEMNAIREALDLLMKHSPP